MCCDTNHRKGYSMMEDPIKRLKALSREELLKKWKKMGELTLPQHTRKEFIIKHLTWLIQTQRQGGYSPQIRKKLEALAKDLEQNKEINNDSLKSNSLTIKAGTKLIREYQGKNHEVLVLEKGYQYKEKFYRSLSAIANEITSTRWNGKVFFGLKKGA